MKRLVIPILALIALSGCERREIISTRTEGRVTTSLSCHRAGYCLTCMPGVDGTTGCRLRFSMYCPGVQRAEGDLVREVYRYPSDPERVLEETRVENATPAGACL